jgi:GAF domain-containing protein
VGPADGHVDDEALGGLSGVLLNAETVDRMLILVADLAARALTGAAVSVTLPGDDGPYTPNATAAVARELDEVQYEAGEGPCLSALRGSEPVSSAITDAAERWPAFAAAAEERGVGAIHSSPLRTSDRTIGAMNVYLDSADPLTDVDVEMIALLAEQGASVVACAFAYNEVSTLASQLQEALASRDLIGQAKGILMRTEGCDANAAFDLLRRASQRTNRKLRDVAADLVASTTR